MMLTDKILPLWFALFPFILIVIAIEPYRMSIIIIRLSMPFADDLQALRVNFGPRQL